MSKTFVGARAQNMDIGAEVAAITRVNLVVDSDHMYTVGNATGRTIEVECPWGTEKMASDILAKVSGVNYKPFSAEKALLDPAFEIGDAVTIGGVYSQIAGADCTYNGASLFNIEAPDLDEIDDEYPAQQTQQSSIKRQLAYTRSLISKTSEQILLKVEGSDGKGGLAGQVAAIETNLDNISISVSNETDSSSITLKIGETEIKSPDIKITGMVTFDSLSGTPTGTTRINGGWIDADTLNVKAANISGTIVATRLQGQQVFLNTDQLVQVGVDAYGRPVFDYAVAGAMLITGANTSDFAVEVGSNGAMRLKALNGAVDISSGYSVTSSITGNLMQGEVGINLFGDPNYGAVVSIRGGHIVSASDNRYSCGTPLNRWAMVYAGTGTIQTSDRNAKNSIEVLPEKYTAMLDQLEPKRFKMNDGTSGRYHVGFIAQEVEAAMASAGISSTEFGGFVKDKDKNGNDIYMLRYDEFVALNTRQIQLLKARVAELEAKL